MLTNLPAVRLALSPALAALILLAASPTESMAQAPGKTTLRWKLKAGEVLHYQTHQVTTSKIKDPEGKEIAQTLTLTIDLTWTVKAVEPSGSAMLSQTIDRIRTTATLPFGKFSFDSREAGDATGPAGPIFKMLVGSETAFTMSPLGELSDIKLSSKLLETLKADEPAAAQGQFSEVGLKNMLTQMGLAFPEQPLDVGGSWVRKLPIPAGPDGQTRDVVQTYTYRGPDPNGSEAVELAAKFDPIKPDPNVPVAIKKEEAGGRFLFDNANGRISSSTFTTSVDLTGQIEGKEIAQSTGTVTTTTLAKDKAP